MSRGLIEGFEQKTLPGDGIEIEAWLAEAGPFASAARLSRDADVLAGCGYLLVENLRWSYRICGDMRALVGKCDSCQFSRLALEQFRQPSRILARSPRVMNDSSCSIHQDGLQSFIAGSSDTTEPHLAAGRVIFRRQP